MSVYKTDAKIPVVWQVGDVMLDEIEVKAKLGEGHLGARDLVYHRNFKVELAVTSVDADLFGGQTAELMRQVSKWVQLGLHPLSWYGGLDYIAECYSGWCLVKHCGKHGGNYDGTSYQLY